MWSHTLLIQELRRQKPGDLYEFEASLVYIEFQYSHGYVVISSKKILVYIN